MHYCCVQECTISGANHGYLREEIKLESSPRKHDLERSRGELNDQWYGLQPVPAGRTTWRWDRLVKPSIYCEGTPIPSERRMTEETTQLAASTIVKSHPSQSAVSITIAITISSILHPLLLVIVIHHTWRHCKTLLRFNLFEIQFPQYNVYDY